ncbi:ferredoxin-NADP reductase [Endozoicomonas sp. NE40]|uniref:Ferredoxin-NADP reductase n=2 Tax=Endozoicomonas lisbonensis TaxID=3120522 RepID=A0ABV2SKS1_9GAMM
MIVLMDDDPFDVLVNYANRDEQSVIFREELAVIEADYKDRLQVVYLYDNVDGYLSVPLL